MCLVVETYSIGFSVIEVKVTAGRGISVSSSSLSSVYTVNQKNHTKMFLSYLPQNPVDFDKIWYTLSRINLRYSNLNVFKLTSILSLQYLVKPSIHVL